MTIAKGLGTVAGCAVGASVLGALAGYLIGLLLPGAYVAMFRPPPGQTFKPTDVGIALGVAQGFIVGAVVGILLVAVVTWYEVRTTQTRPHRDTSL